MYENRLVIPNGKVGCRACVVCGSCRDARHVRPLASKGSKSGKARWCGLSELTRIEVRHEAEGLQSYAVIFWAFSPSFEKEDILKLEMSVTFQVVFMNKLCSIYSMAVEVYIHWRMQYIFDDDWSISSPAMAILEGQGNGFLTTGLLGANYGHR